MTKPTEIGLFSKATRTEPLFIKPNINNKFELVLEEILL